MTPSFFLSITEKYSFFIRQVGFQMYIIYYMKPKRRNDKKVVYRWRIKLRCGKQDRGFFFTMTLYNNLEKGCSAAWQRVCFGYKMSRVQILSSLPITSPMGSNEGSIEIDSNWTKFRVSFFYMHAKIILFFTALSPVVRKRSQFSSVERGSPKPNVVGSNPTERDSVLVM